MKRYILATPDRKAFLAYIKADGSPLMTPNWLEAGEWSENSLPVVLQVAGLTLEIVTIYVP